MFSLSYLFNKQGGKAYEKQKTHFTDTCYAVVNTDDTNKSPIQLNSFC